ncbi:MAG: hypothetical protein NVS2B3_15180 [Vulcanimicrobiaceae bacterium]
MLNIDYAGQRLATTLRALTCVGEALSTNVDLHDALKGVVVACVPSLFEGAGVDARAFDGWPNYRASAGTLETAAASFELTVRGETFGTLIVSKAPLALDEIDRAVATDLAARIALAVHTSHALAREHRVADTLQRALLPDSLPQGERVTASAAYLPGTQEAIVGGDWYDVFDLPDGRMAFSIGDVAGHGLQAAVVMGEVRQAFRAAAVNPKSPSLVLERANTIVNMRADTAIVTAIFGIFERATSTVTYAVAGHPPPILGTRDGTAQTLPARGIPLGVADSVFTHDWTFTLPPGSLLALYTDGLTEHSRDVARGEEQLLDAVRAQIVSPTSDPARSIVERIFTDRKNADDVAALVLAIDDDAPSDFAFVFSSLPLAVSIMRRTFAHYLQQRGVRDDDVQAILLAVGEAAANAVEHAYVGEPGLVRVLASHRDDTLVVDVLDGGSWKPIERRDERGRGIKIMRALMDRIEIRTMQSETSVRLTARLPLEANALTFR